MTDFKYKHGLCVMRAQPFHIGHQRIINYMLRDCAQVIVVLGSIQESGTERNPFDYETRKRMITNVYQNSENFKRLHICGLKDINDPKEWKNYVLKCIDEKFPEISEIDVYYAGSESDAMYFKSCCKFIEIIDRNDSSFPYVSGTMVREMIKFGDKRWKEFVAPENYALIEKAAL